VGTTAIRSRVDAARTLTEILLRDLPDRWAHSAGVADRAEQLAVTVAPTDQETLVAAAWLHDIGYSDRLHDTGFHPLDGATYLRRHGWPTRICGLVAHHSGALFVARAHGLDTELGRFPRELSPVSDALTYADQTVGPGGRPMTLDERMSEMLARRGPDSLQAQVHHLREPHLRATAQRVERRLSE
jgi:putative nucleotidyltransferase with HDIG domain